MKTHSIFTALLGSLALVAIGTAQEKGPTDAEKASKAQTEVYVAAFNKGDAKALAGRYAEDAQYTSDDGGTIIGRNSIAEGLTKFFGANKGAKLDAQIESARFLTPDVLVEKGFSTIDDATTRYVCTYVKKDGAWLISELSETTLPPEDAAAVALDELGWMVGSWKDSGQGPAVTTTADWTKNRHFIRRSITISREDEDPLDATEVIGYDPAADGIRSWVFDSEGGFGEGAWKRDGDKWIISFTATAPDGATSTAQHVITYIDEKKFTWESINRQSKGEALPNLDKIEVVRTATATAAQ